METLQTKQILRAAQLLGRQYFWMVKTDQDQLCLTWLYIMDNINIQNLEEVLAWEEIT